MQIKNRYLENIAQAGFIAILKELNSEKNRDPLDGDETEAICGRLLIMLDKHEGNMESD